MPFCLAAEASLAWKKFVDIAGLTINFVVAIGTLAVAFLAIWGDALKVRVWGPKIRIEKGLEVGHADVINAQPRIYYHMLVTNHRAGAPGENCRVMLHGIEERRVDDTFHPVYVAFTCPFPWSPSNAAPRTKMVKAEQAETFDFGYLTEDGFHLTLLDAPSGLSHSVRANKCLRYRVAVIADNFVEKGEHLFQVSWNGIFDPIPEVAAQHLRIEQIEGQSRREPIDRLASIVLTATKLFDRVTPRF